jgi:hypothetical protein
MKLHYLQLWIRRDTRKVMRCDEEELTVRHFRLGKVDQQADRKLSCWGVEEDIELVQNSKRSLQVLAERQK